MVGLLDEDLGPVEVVAIGFGELRFDQRVLGEITDLVDRGLLRIVDLLGVRKGVDEVVRSDEHSVLEREAQELFDGLAPTGFELLGDDDVDLAAAELMPGGSAIIVVWEERWARPLTNAIRRAGGAVLIHQLVPRDVLVELLGDPGSGVVMLFGGALNVGDFVAPTDVTGSDIVLAVISIIATWIAAHFARKATLSLGHRVDGMPAGLASTAGRVVHTFVWLIGVGVALTFLGAPVQPLLTAAIVVAVVAALALRGIANNYAAGVVLQTRHPIRVGDEIISSGFNGTVSEINGRAVIVETFDGLTVHLPNTDFIENPIVNVSTLGARRSEVQVRCSTATMPRDEVVATVLGAVAGAEDVNADPSATTFLTAVDFEQITLLVQFWHAPSRAGAARSNVVTAVADSLQSVDPQVTVISPPPPPITPPPVR